LPPQRYGEHPKRRKRFCTVCSTGQKHARLAEIEVLEHDRALRREWFETMLRSDSLGNLYFEAVPPFLLAPGETPTSVAREVASLDGWKAEDLYDDSTRLIRSHVRVTRPDGRRPSSNATTSDESAKTLRGYFRKKETT
jgi:hypothetical protein